MPPTQGTVRREFASSPRAVVAVRRHRLVSLSSRTVHLALPNWPNSMAWPQRPSDH